MSLFPLLYNLKEYMEQDLMLRDDFRYLQTLCLNFYSIARKCWLR